MVDRTKNSSPYTMDEEDDHKLYNFPYATPETLTKEYLEDLIVELENLGAPDPEVAHRLEKTVMECFIANIVAKKYTVEEAVLIGKLILDITKIPFPRWFA